jgi:hypothetical protein
MELCRTSEANATKSPPSSKVIIAPDPAKVKQIIGDAIREGRYNPGSTEHFCSVCRRWVRGVALLDHRRAVCFPCSEPPKEIKLPAKGAA